jgi:hypothetical protein
MACRLFTLTGIHKQDYGLAAEKYFPWDLSSLENLQTVKAIAS